MVIYVAYNLRQMLQTSQHYIIVITKTILIDSLIINCQGNADFV